jgi:hypothetical protein
MIATSILLMAVAVTILALLSGLHSSNYRLRSVSWEELVQQIKPVPTANLHRLALEHLDPQSCMEELELDEMWKLVDGMEGLNRIRANTRVLIALAAHVQQWNYTEATIVAERMRRDATRIRHALLKAEIEVLLRKKWTRMPFYIHEIASSYYLMTKRLLALYQTSHVGLLPRLQQAL